MHILVIFGILAVTFLLIVNALQVGFASRKAYQKRNKAALVEVRRYTINKQACPACHGEGFLMNEVATTVWEKTRASKQRGAPVTYSNPSQVTQLKKVPCTSCCATGFAARRAEIIGRP